MKYKKKMETVQSPAVNLGLAQWRHSPQKRQCEFESYYPARTFVKPPLRQAAGRCLQADNSTAKQ